MNLIYLKQLQCNYKRELKHRFKIIIFALSAVLRKVTYLISLAILKPIASQGMLSELTILEICGSLQSNEMCSIRVENDSANLTRQ